MRSARRPRRSNHALIAPPSCRGLQHASWSTEANALGSSTAPPAWRMKCPFDRHHTRRPPTSKGLTVWTSLMFTLFTGSSLIFTAFTLCPGFACSTWLVDSTHRLVHPDAIRRNRRDDTRKRCDEPPAGGAGLNPHRRAWTTRASISAPEGGPAWARRLYAERRALRRPLTRKGE